MAFVADDGTGLATANAYIDVAYADEYHADRGATAWSFSDTEGTTAITQTQKEQAIVRATDHVDRTFGHRFRGYVASSSQALKWPRSEAYDPSEYALTEIPLQLQKAVAEYALRALLYGTLTPDAPPPVPRQAFTSGEALVEYGEGGSGEVTQYRDKTGPLETEVRYAAGTSGQMPSHPAADNILKPLLKSWDGRIVRG